MLVVHEANGVRVEVCHTQCDGGWYLYQYDFTAKRGRISERFYKSTDRAAKAYHWRTVKWQPWSAHTYEPV